MPEVAGVRHEYRQIDGLRIHYAEAGDGDPLILLHGWPQHWWAWRELITPLSERYRVICPDVRGMGWSEGSGGGYTWERLARDVIELMDQLGIQRARLIGHDWGLVTGYRACFNWPDRFEHFTALGGIHLWSLDGGPLRLWLAPWHIYLIALLGRTATTRLGITERCLHAWRHTGRFTPEETELYMRNMRRTDAETATVRFDRNVVLRELPHFARHYRAIRQRVPTLHLNGEHDPLTIGVPETYRDYADDMRLELVPDCGHFIAEERPDWLLERLRLLKE
jgi:pimeloyl-ACP methyl ester carboxylesterase